METTPAPLSPEPPLLTAAEATRRGFYRLTCSYQRKERWMLQRVLNDLSRSRINAVLVIEHQGLCIYRARRSSPRSLGANFRAACARIAEARRSSPRSLGANENINSAIPQADSNAAPRGLRI